MRSSTIALLVAFVSAASATIYVTEPVATTTCSAGVPCNVRWNDDGNVPVLASIGATQIDLCTGGVQQQTCLQNISPSTDVSTNAYVTYNPDPTVGGNGNMWFVKFTSLVLKDATNPQFPFTAYSAKFTLNGMTGTFNSTVQAQINGASTGVPVSAAAPSSSAPAGSSSIATVTVKSTGAATSAKSTSSATTSAKANGAAGVTAPGVVSGVTSVGFFMSFFSVFFGMLAFGL